MRAPAERNPDLGAVASPENGTVLQKKNMKSQTGRRKRGHASRHSSSRDDQIIVPGIVNRNNRAFLLPELLQCATAVGRDIHRIRGEVERITASVEPREIVQRDGMLPR